MTEIGDGHYKALLFEVLCHLAHQEDGGADRRLMEWLLVLEHISHSRGDAAERQAVVEAIEHLALQQARRQIDRSSGLPDG